MEHAPSLVELIHRFNLAPSRDADASWMPLGWTPSHQERLDADHRIQDVMSIWLLARHGLRGRFCFDFSVQERRFALLPRSELHTLARHMALVACKNVLRSAIDKLSVDRLIRSLGVEAYEFALLKAPDLRGAAAAPPVRLETHRAELQHHLLVEGGRHLMALFEPDCVAIRGRVGLKLPRDVSRAETLTLSPREQAVARDVVTACIIPEVLPQWDWLF
jgi:type III secretion protein K